jgi:hypothetical protein
MFVDMINSTFKASRSFKGEAWKKLEEDGPTVEEVGDSDLD